MNERCCSTHRQIAEATTAITPNKALNLGSLQWNPPGQDSVANARTNTNSKKQKTTTNKQTKPAKQPQASGQNLLLPSTSAPTLRVLSLPQHQHQHPHHFLFGVPLYPVVSLRCSVTRRQGYYLAVTINFLSPVKVMIHEEGLIQRAEQVSKLCCFLRLS